MAVTKTDKKIILMGVIVLIVAGIGIALHNSDTKVIAYPTEEDDTDDGCNDWKCTGDDGDNDTDEPDDTKPTYDNVSIFIDWLQSARSWRYSRLQTQFNKYANDEDRPMYFSTWFQWRHPLLYGRLYRQFERNN